MGGIPETMAWRILMVLYTMYDVLNTIYYIPHTLYHILYTSLKTLQIRWSVRALNQDRRSTGSWCPRQVVAAVQLP